MIDFKFLIDTNIYFINKILYEDVFFGIMLFAQANRIYMLDKRLYNYCIHPQTLSNYDKNIKKENIPLYMQEIYATFNNAFMAKQYFDIYSFCRGTLKLIDFMESNLTKNLDINNRNIEDFKYLLLFRIYAILKMRNFGYTEQKDPWNTYDLLAKLIKYIADDPSIKNNLNLKSFIRFKIFHFFLTYPRFLPFLRVALIIRRTLRQLLRRP